MFYCSIVAAVKSKSLFATAITELPYQYALEMNGDDSNSDNDNKNNNREEGSHVAISACSYVTNTPYNEAAQNRSSVYQCQAADFAFFEPVQARPIIQAHAYV